MKVEATRDKVPAFVPVTVTITLESAAEAHALYALANSSISVTQVIAREVKEPYALVNRLLEGLFGPLHALFGGKESIR